MKLKRTTIVSSLCIALSSCAGTGGHSGFMRPRPAPVGADAHNPCATLKTMATINPIYPASAVPVKQDGWVLLQYDVAASGVPHNINVLDSSPPGVFDQASVNAIVQWRYARKSFPTGECMHLDTYSIK